MLWKYKQDDNTSLSEREDGSDMNQDTNLLERLKSEMRKLHYEVSIVNVLLILATYSYTGFRFWFFLMVLGLFSLVDQEYQIHGNQKPLGRASLYCGHVN